MRFENGRKKFGLRDLLSEQTRDLYDAARQFRDHLQELRLAAVSSELSALLEQMLADSFENVSSLETACGQLMVPPEGVSCQAMSGLVRECKEATSDWEDSATRDAAIIAIVQRVTHYGIAGFGTAAEFARVVKEPMVQSIMKTLLRQSAEYDAQLTKIAVGGWFSTGINEESATGFNEDSSK